jgi:hypothetical protein
MKGQDESDPIPFPPKGAVHSETDHSFPFRNPLQISKLLVDLRTNWPHHLERTCTGNGSEP